MINPASLMRLMNAKKQFANNHPKFVSYLKKVYGSGIEEGTIIEMTVTKPGKQPVTANLRVVQSDLELMQELRELLKENRP